MRRGGRTQEEGRKEGSEEGEELWRCSRLGGREARKAGQGVWLWSTGAAIAGVCWREHHTASSPWQQPNHGEGGHAKTLGQQSHNPLVCVSDEGAFGSVLFQGGVSLVLIKRDQINQRNQIGSSFLLCVRSVL